MTQTQLYMNNYQDMRNHLDQEFQLQRDRAMNRIQEIMDACATPRSLNKMETYEVDATCQPEKTKYIKNL